MNQDIKLLHALADPIRLRTLFLLRHMELSIGELAQLLACSQPSISKHVRLLIECGLATRRKEGNWTFLCLGDPALVNPVFALLEAWVPVHGTSPWLAADATRLTAIQAERAEGAAAYFRDHAGEWDRLRALHIPVDEVDKAILSALRDHKPGRMVDIGTGTGTMLELFAHRADHMIGIDRSPDMLRFGRAKLAQANIANAELRQGDMLSVDLKNGSADTVLLHQVLHYTRHPAAAVAEAARLLTDDGLLIIVDIAPHHMEELRSDHAHVRLGFSDEEMLGYFDAAGLTGAVANHLTGGALTVTIWTGRRRDAQQYRSTSSS